MRYSILLVILLQASLCNAHDNKLVHPSDLSASAMELLVKTKNSLDPYYEIYAYFSPCSGLSCIKQGTIDEDLKISGEYRYGKFINHFYNPITGAALSSRLISGNPITAKEYGAGIFDDAVQTYLEGNTAYAYYKLGRAIHVLQDLSSPAHVAVVSHPLEGIIYDLNTYLMNWGIVTGYEAWVRTKSGTLSRGNTPVLLRSWNDFSQNLAHATYAASVISGTVNESEEAPSTGELAEMFPPATVVLRFRV